MKKELEISGMSCEHCARRVTEALERVPGVLRAAVSLSAGKAEVEAEAGLDEGALKAAVEKAGYRVVGIS